MSNTIRGGIKTVLSYNKVTSPEVPSLIADTYIASFGVAIAKHSRPED